MRRPTFGEVFLVWLVLDLACVFINILTIRSAALSRVVRASLGVFLLFVPVYPASFRRWWNEEECRLAIRILAAAQIVVSFLNGLSVFELPL